MEIAKELLIGIQLPSKTGPLVPTHRKMKRVNKSYSGLVGKPQKVRQGRKLFSACISPCPSALPPLFFLATEAGNRMVYPQPPPWTWGGGQVTSGLTQFLPASFTKATGVGRRGQKTYPTITPETQTQASSLSPVHFPNPRVTLTTSVNPSPGQCNSQ